MLLFSLYQGICIKKPIENFGTKNGWWAAIKNSDFEIDTIGNFDTFILKGPGAKPPKDLLDISHKDMNKDRPGLNKNGGRRSGSVRVTADEISPTRLTAPTTKINYKYA